MKRTIGTRRIGIALAAALFAPAALHAQTASLHQGKVELDGAASFSSSGTGGESDRTTTITLSPSVLYFVSDNLALGGTLQTTYYKYSGSSASFWSIGPEATVYLGSADAAVRPYLNVRAGLGRNSFDGGSNAGPTREHRSVKQVRASAGLLDLLTPSVGIHGEFFYDRGSFGDPGAGSSDAFGLAFGFNIFLGG